VVGRGWLPPGQLSSRRRLRTHRRADAAITSRVPGAMQRSSRCFAEPGPGSSNRKQPGPRLCSAPLRKCYALRCVRSKILPQLPHCLRLVIALDRDHDRDLGIELHGFSPSFRDAFRRRRRRPGIQTLSRVAGFRVRAKTRAPE
jgi:hypothetical protein